MVTKFLEAIKMCPGQISCTSIRPIIKKSLKNHIRLHFKQNIYPEKEKVNLSAVAVAFLSQFF